MTALPPEEAVGAAAGRSHLEFDDNLLLPLLYGERDPRLDRINGSSAYRSSPAATASPSVRFGYEAAHLVLSQLYDRLRPGQESRCPSVEAAIRLAEAELGDEGMSLSREDEAFHTRKHHITARSPGQAAYVKALRENDLMFGLGPAGAGKTYSPSPRRSIC